MNEIDKSELEGLYKRGETETLQSGEEGVRLTVQFRGRPASADRRAWRSTLEDWERHLAHDIKSFGAEIVDGSLSMSGQTVELIVPIKDLEAAVQKLSEEDVGVRLSKERTIDPQY